GRRAGQWPRLVVLSPLSMQPDRLFDLFYYCNLPAKEVGFAAAVKWRGRIHFSASTPTQTVCNAVRARFLMKTFARLPISGGTSSEPIVCVFLFASSGNKCRLIADGAGES